MGTEIYSHIHAHKCTRGLFHVLSHFMEKCFASGPRKNIHLFSSNVSSVSELQVRNSYSLTTCSPVDMQHLDSCSHSWMTVPQHSKSCEWGAINKHWSRKNSESLCGPASDRPDVAIDLWWWTSCKHKRDLERSALSSRSMFKGLCSKCDVKLSLYFGQVQKKQHLT